MRRIQLNITLNKNLCKFTYHRFGKKVVFNTQFIKTMRFSKIKIQVAMDVSKKIISTAHGCTVTTSILN